MLVPIFQLEKIENSICLFAQVVNHKSQPVGENQLAMPNCSQICENRSSKKPDTLPQLSTH